MQERDTSVSKKATKKKAKRKTRRKVTGAGASEAAPAVPPAEAPDPFHVPAKPGRDEEGKFVAGHQHSVGRPKGSRNRITEERLALEAALREYLGEEGNANKAKAAIDRIFTIASQGEDKDAIQAIKLLLDKVMTSPKQEETGGGGSNTLHITIDRAAEAGGNPVEVVLDPTDYEVIDNG